MQQAHCSSFLLSLSWFCCVLWPLCLPQCPGSGTQRGDKSSHIRTVIYLLPQPRWAPVKPLVKLRSCFAFLFSSSHIFLEAVFSHLLFVLNAGGRRTHHVKFPAWTMPGEAGPGCEGACWEHGHITAVKEAACTTPLLMWSVWLWPRGGAGSPCPSRRRLQGSQPEPGEAGGSSQQSSSQQDPS